MRVELTYDQALFQVVERDADAIEHAMHEDRLANLGLRSDDEVRAQIAVSLAEAGLGERAMAALAAADYCDDPALFAPRRWAALWRACQLHGCEALYWTLQGPDPAQFAVPLASLRCAVPGCGSEGPFEPLGSLPVCVTCRAARREGEQATAAGGPA